MSFELQSTTVTVSTAAACALIALASMMCGVNAEMDRCAERSCYPATGNLLIGTSFGRAFLFTLRGISLLL